MGLRLGFSQIVLVLVVPVRMILRKAYFVGYVMRTQGCSGVEWDIVGLTAWGVEQGSNVQGRCWSQFVASPHYKPSRAKKTCVDDTIDGGNPASFGIPPPNMEQF